MAFRDYRNPHKKSVTPEFNIERFSHDVFAYILRICGFPEAKIPTSSLKENTYMKDDIVKNLGLAALQIALYERDEWNKEFKAIHEDEIYSIFEQGVQGVNKMSRNTENEDEAQFELICSLAFYTEFALFLYGEGKESYINCLPQFWSHLCIETIAASEDRCDVLECLLTMNAEMTEPWIIDFIKQFAIPYGSSDDVSERFAWYVLEYEVQKDTCSQQTSSESVARAVPE